MEIVVSRGAPAGTRWAAPTTPSGFTEATAGREALGQLVPAWIIEPAGNRDMLRVLTKARDRPACYAALPTAAGPGRRRRMRPRSPEGQAAREGNAGP